MHKCLASVFVLLCSIGAAQNDTAKHPRPDHVIRRFMAMKVSPDGQYIAFVQYTPQYSRLSIQRVDGGQPGLLPGRQFWRFVPGPPERTSARRQAQIAWSPDSNRLAYVALDAQETLRLWLWDRRTETAEPVAGLVACGEDRPASPPRCSENHVQWSSDSRTAYFLGNVESSPAPASNVAPAAKPAAGSSSSDQQVIVRTTSAAREPVAADTRPFADVFALTSGQRQPLRLTRGERLFFLSLSPTGSALLAARPHPGTVWRRGAPKQDYLDYLIIPIEGHLQGPISQIVPAIDSAAQRYPLIAWSPDGTKLAYIEHGAATDGDVRIFDVRSRAIVTASGDFKPTPEHAAAAERFSRHALYPGTKFGSSTLPPAWRFDGDRLLVQRRERLGLGWRTTLWELDVRSGKANAVIRDPDCNVVSAWDRGGATQRQDAQRAEPRTAAFLYCEGGLSKLVSIGAERETAQIGSAVALDKPMFIGVSERILAFVSQSPAKGDEAYLYHYGVDVPVQITHVNTDAAREPYVAQTVAWQSKSGQRLWGMLVRAEHVDPATSPLIVDVYPHEGSEIALPPHRWARVDEELRPLLRPLLDRGFTFLIPQIPVSGHGDTCVDVVADIESAVSGIAAQQLADTTRSGIVGHSFGGWTVNCVVGRSNRFKAAVSIAGVADLISNHFTDVGRVVVRGGGQINVGKDLDDAPMLYWKESPISSVANVSTPLLLLHGKQDRSVGHDQSVEMFNGLLDLGKEATLVLYEHLGHGDILDDPDVSSRITEWFIARLAK